MAWQALSAERQPAAVFGFVPQGGAATTEPMAKRPRVGGDYFDDDDDNDYTSGHRRSAPGASKEAEEEDDPLDAFMAGVAEEVKAVNTATKPPVAKASRADIDEIDDHVLSFWLCLTSADSLLMRQEAPLKAAPATTTTSPTNTTTRVTSLRRWQLNFSFLFSFFILFTQVSKDLLKDVMPGPDHSQMDYLEIAKDFLVEHPDVAALAPATVRDLRNALGLHVSGIDVAKVIVGFL
jgi:ATP-dependent RNA helicase DDX42